jgi:hypothetical protein
VEKKASSESKVGEQEEWMSIQGRWTRNPIQFSRRVGKKPCSVSKVGEKPVQVQSRWARNLVHIQSRWTRKQANKKPSSAFNVD